MRKIIIICGILSMLPQLHGQNLFSDNFEQGLKNWRINPADTASVKIEKSEDGRSMLAIVPKNASLELNSCALKTDRDLNAAGTYKITYEMNVAAVSTGCFNLSLVFNGAKDKPLKQYPVSAFTTGQKT